MSNRRACLDDKSSIDFGIRRTHNVSKSIEKIEWFIGCEVSKASFVVVQQLPDFEPQTLFLVLPFSSSLTRNE